MSSMIYLSSDYPIPEIQNPHERSLSINEALELGLEVPEYLLKNGIDRNWKNAIHWADRSIHFDLDNGTIDDGDFDDDYAIIPIYPGRRDIHSAKKYQSRIECIWTLGRAKCVLAVIKQLLESTDEVEFWEFVQFLFFRQWETLRSYAHKKGIQFMKHRKKQKMKQKVC